MNEAIKLAKEKGGYNDLFRGPAVLDSLFWQALGKALGWDGQYSGWCAYNQHYIEDEDWRCYAHQYFDLLLTGGDTEKFWKGLLNE